MVGIVIHHQDLPEDFAATLRDLHAQACQPGGADASERLNALLALAREHGWTLAALARSLGVSREAVRQRASRGELRADTPAVPSPPKRPTPMPKPPKRQRLKVRPEVAERLREMNRIARTVNGATPADHPARKVSVELSAMLNSLVEQGVSKYHLAQVLGVSHGAIIARLARHGYRAPAPSQASSLYIGAPRWKRKDKCLRGHPLSGDNLYVTPKGQRTCRECGRIRSRAYRRRRAAQQGGA
jgi:hypothetical protein